METSSEILKIQCLGNSRRQIINEFCRIALLLISIIDYQNIVLPAKGVGLSPINKWILKT